MTRQQVETYEAARWRGLGWYGITPGSRSMMLWGNPIELSRQAQLTSRLREQLLKNRRILSAYQLSNRYTYSVKLIERYQPEYLYGYATILTAFARMIEQHKIALHCRLKAVVSTSETLSDRSPHCSNGYSIALWQMNTARGTRGFWRTAVRRAACT